VRAVALPSATSYLQRSYPIPIFQLNTQQAAVPPATSNRPILLLWIQNQGWQKGLKRLSTRLWTLNTVLDNYLGKQ
jgi:hypothetical protein